MKAIYFVHHIYFVMDKIYFECEFRDVLESQRIQEVSKFLEMGF